MLGHKSAFLLRNEPPTSLRFFADEPVLVPHQAEHGVRHLAEGRGHVCMKHEANEANKQTNKHKRLMACIFVGKGNGDNCPPKGGEPPQSGSCPAVTRMPTTLHRTGDQAEDSGFTKTLASPACRTSSCRSSSAVAQRTHGGPQPKGGDGGGATMSETRK